ncbi:unnamed protein product [Owenia fusiformis]|uniref:Uncharacterized protein n=1 Tax=Owenia fusiformis TaxID=6347 RepID=A0A8J1TZF0_OWEFU|nr:unnamed protein product [Owenia fusiformis]
MDAEDAVRGLDGTYICGSRVRVEMSNGKIRPKPWQRDRGRSGGGRPYSSSDLCYRCNKPGHYAYDCRGGFRGSRRAASITRSPAPR